jgi:hypothetical protein
MPCTSSGLVSGRTMMTARPSSFAHRSAVSASKAIWPTAAPGETLRPTGHERSPAGGSAHRSGGELRMQKEVDLLRRHPQHRLLAADQPLLGHVDGDADGGLRRALGVARLQHPELAALDGELDVLHVAVVALELGADRLELGVGDRHQLLEPLDRLGLPDAGDDVLALGVDQEVAFDVGLAGRRLRVMATPVPSRRPCCRRPWCRC